jgi:hypothetical protein
VVYAGSAGEFVKQAFDGREKQGTLGYLNESKERKS